MRTYNYSSYDVRLLAIIMVIDSSGYLRIAGYTLLIIKQLIKVQVIDES